MVQSTFYENRSLLKMTIQDLVAGLDARWDKHLCSCMFKDVSEGTCQTLSRRLFERYILFIKCFVCGIFSISVTKLFGFVI
jgi:hypothetical protein